MYDLIVSGGRIVSEDGSHLADIAVEDGRIAEIAPRIEGACRRRIDATGLLVLPGLIDPHVHLGLPTKGTVSCDDPETGTAAALFGGVTTILDFTVQRPGEGLVESLDRRVREFEGRTHCDYALHVNVTDFGSGFEDRFPRELDALAGRGARSLKLFTTYSAEGMRCDPDSLRIVLRDAAKRGFTVLVHAEDDRLVREATAALLAAGRTAPSDFPGSRPAEAEARAIGAVIDAAIEVDSPVYFVHVSSAAGLHAALAGRHRSGKPIFIETCPQYLALDDRAYSSEDAAQFIVTPPLRKPADREALLDALADGEIDVVATDHCPFRREQRDRPGAPFTEIPSGLPGLETRLPILHTLAVLSGRMGIETLVRVASANPARIFGLHPRKGCIRPQADADLVLFDPDAAWTIRPDLLHGNADFSPYDGMPVRGAARMTILRGRVVVEGGRIAGRAEGRRMMESG